MCEAGRAGRCYGLSRPCRLEVTNDMREDLRKKMQKVWLKFGSWVVLCTIYGYNRAPWLMLNMGVRLRCMWFKLEDHSQRANHEGCPTSPIENALTLKIGIISYHSTIVRKIIR